MGAIYYIEIKFVVSQSLRLKEDEKYDTNTLNKIII